jgi:hypothetical protein
MLEGRVLLQQILQTKPLQVAGTVEVVEPLIILVRFKMEQVAVVDLTFAHLPIYQLD